MRKPQHKLNHMFLTEQRIMDLWDRGFSIERICERGFAEGTVRTVVSRFASADERDFDNMVRLGSLALLAAIRKHHPESSR